MNPYGPFGEPYDPDKFAKLAAKVCMTPEASSKPTPTKYRFKLNFKETSKSPSVLRKTDATLIVDDVARKSSFAANGAQVDHGSTPIERDETMTHLPSISKQNIQFPQSTRAETTKPEATEKPAKATKARIKSLTNKVKEAV